METTGNLKIKGNTAYQHIDNGGAVFTVNENGLTIETSFFGYGYTTVQIPYFNKEEFIKFLEQVKTKA